MMLAAMCYILRTGVPWRDLPPQFGPWSSVYTRFRRWCASGLWGQIFAAVSARPTDAIRSVDCSHIKVHRHAANTHGGHAAQAMGRTKGGLNTKLAAVVDGHGRAVAIAIAPGNQHDLQAIEPLVPALRDCYVAADRAFDSADFRRELAEFNSILATPSRSTRKRPYYYSKRLYRHRHTVENYFCRIKAHRRIATRYEKLAVTFLGFVTLATTLDWILFEV